MVDRRYARPPGMSKTDTFKINVAAHPEIARAGLITLYAPPECALSSAWPLQEGETLIGRETPADLVLPSKSVSRAHAKIHRRGAEWLIEDLGSRNGTHVNGQRVQRATLSDRDQVRLGAVVVAFISAGVERYSRPEPPSDARVSALVGGARMAELRQEVLRVSPSALSVLVLGESGTGKELVARALHAGSGRRGAFAAINCAAVPAGLLEAELFGAKRGAFTGLDRDRLGLVRSAEGGTLFLDEIGDMPTEAQAKLLRMLDTRQVTPLGSHEQVPVDVRIVSATHRPVAELVADGRFRADLYARVAAHTMELAPLRERKEDIAPLVGAFLRALGARQTVSAPFMVGLLAYDWPLNVRELQAAIHRAVALAGEAPVLDESHLPPAALQHALATREAPEQASRHTAPPVNELRALMQEHAGNVAAVARAVGKDRAQVHRWLKHHGLSPSSFRR